MSRLLPAPRPGPQGQLLLGPEPILAHCNFYNYWLQKTVLLVEGLGMEDVIRDAAAGLAHAYVTGAAATLGVETPAERARVAEDFFANQGFGTLRLGDVTPDGGAATTPSSHYGQLFQSIAQVERFEAPQNLFDQGFIAGAASAVHGLEPGAFELDGVRCHSVGDAIGEVRLKRASEPRAPFPAPGPGPGGAVAAPAASEFSTLDEPAILEALAGLDFSGNEEGFIPRFGLMLTFHWANFYNRVSFEFHRRMKDTGFIEEAETLLTDAGHQCAFNTFGGIMTSAEWDAVIRPQIKNRTDEVHGMMAVVNALGWGVYRAVEVSSNRCVVQIWDDYESRGHRAMYGDADRPINFLAMGAVVGTMNLIEVGDIASKPDRSGDFYARVFNSEQSFKGRITKSSAMGDPVTEIVAER